MKKEHDYWVYIATNWKKTVLYVGVTNNLKRRLIAHYQNRGRPETFAGKYYCYNLVYYEWHKYIYNALAREKEIKKFSRANKNALIEELNSGWSFFNAVICEGWPPQEGQGDGCANEP
jgi:Predicted endonuclease containing a URI domain